MVGSKSILLCATACGVRCYALKIYNDILLVLDVEMKWHANGDLFWAVILGGPSFFEIEKFKTDRILVQTHRNNEASVLWIFATLPFFFYSMSAYFVILLAPLLLFLQVSQLDSKKSPIRQKQLQDLTHNQNLHKTLKINMYIKERKRVQTLLKSNQ